MAAVAQAYLFSSSICDEPHSVVVSFSKQYGIFNPNIRIGITFISLDCAMDVSKNFSYSLWW